MDGRIIHQIGHRVVLGAHWGDDCPNHKGTNVVGAHSSENGVYDDTTSLTPPNKTLADFTMEDLPNNCDFCDRSTPANVLVEFIIKPLYDTNNGDPEPGDIIEGT